MPELEINNIPVHFPFEPYDVQKAYMSKVLECLQTGKNGMLESPTGTGKTLSLLCASLAWLSAKKAQMQATSQGVYTTGDGDFVQGLQNQLNNATGQDPGNDMGKWGIMAPRIIYSSRTHSQLTQAMAELKRTQYSHVKVAVLGSRDQLCIHPEVSKEVNASLKVSMCRTLVNARACSFHRNVERKRDDTSFNEKILDIEDLIKVSQRLYSCPYYMTRELKQMADIIFMPYNYILDPRTRKAQDINLQNCVVILDEGHNVEKMCEESASVEIGTVDIATCITEVTEIMKAFATMDEHGMDDSAPKDFTTNDLMYLKKVLLALEKSIDDIALSNNSAEFSGEYMFELLGSAEINHGNHMSLIELMEKMSAFLTTTNTSPFQRTGAGLSKLESFLKVVFLMDRATYQQHVAHVRECYKVYITAENQNQKKPNSWLSKSDDDGKVINFWCFNPAFGMKNLLNQGVYSVIITSGTLSPLPPLIAELGIPIDVTLENGHIISKDQVYVGVLKVGPDGHQLNSSYNTRNDPAYMCSLGRTVRNVSKLIPHGLLVFFPSYYFMEQCKQKWMEDGVWDDINTTKEIFVEPKMKHQLKEVMDKYCNKIVEPGSKGACFLAVCRGKVSEGLDFADHIGRGVIITGLPYPPYLDPRVRMKRQYLDSNKKKVTGQQWYTLEATRSVNQAVGRVIRHKDDYGVILFCDARFGEPYIEREFSSWIRPQIRKHPNFGPLARNLAIFFRNARETLPQPKISALSSGWSGAKPEDVTPSAAPQVAPSFDLSTRYSSSASGSQPPRQHQSNFTWNKSWDAKGATSQVSATSPPEKKETGRLPKNQVSDSRPVTSTSFSIFSRMDEMDSVKQVIDFNSPRQARPQPSPVMCAAGHQNIHHQKTEGQPSLKKRKIRMHISVGFEMERKENQDSAGASANSSTSTVCDIESATMWETMKPKDYLKRVTRILDGGTVKEFYNAVAEYKAQSDYEKLISVLERIFSDPKHRFFILGFKTYIKKTHLDNFSQYCKEKFAV